MAFPYQTALLTGASSGIGWELARELARRGCRVGLIARRQERLHSLAEEIQRTGGTAYYAAADVTDRAALHRAMTELQTRLEGTDLLIANAGVGAPTTLQPINIAAFEKMYRVNVFGVVYAIEAVLPGMLARKRGHIAAVSSLAGYKGLPGEWGYTSSKAAVNNLMEGLRIQLREHGIAVTTICPGFIRTPMTAKNRFHMPWLLEADEAARRIIRALERRKKVFNFPWQMSWLLWLAQRLPDSFIARQMASYNDDPPFPDEPL